MATAAPLNLPSTDHVGECPMTTSQLVELVLTFVDVYNAVARIELYAYQRIFLQRIVESLLDRDGATITGLWSRQSGKSESIACLGSLCIILPALGKVFPHDSRLGPFSRGLRIGVFAPRLQQSGYIYERIRDRAGKPESVTIYQDPDINIRLTVSRGDQVSWSNGSFVRSQTASEQSNVEGGTFELVVLDEAQLISREKVRKEIKPMLASTNGTLVKIGTANIFRGGFHDSITHNVEKERQGHKRNHFEFPYDVVIREKRRTYEIGLAAGKPNPDHLRYEAFVQAELDSLGGNIDNPEFKMNFRLLWQETSLGAVDREAFLTECPEERIEAGDVRLYRRQVAGLDLARRNDDTVLTVVELGDPVDYVGARAMQAPGSELPTYQELLAVAWHMPGHGQWRDQLLSIVDFLQNFAVDTIAVDGTGPGDPVAEMLQDLLPDVQIIPVSFNVVSKDHLYKRYLQEISTGRFRYAAGPRTQQTLEYKLFVKQHEDLEKSYSGRYMCPRAPEGEKDDFPDSAALAVHASTIAKNDMGVVECSDNPFYGSPSSSNSRYAQSSTSRAERYRGSR